MLHEHLPLLWIDPVFHISMMASSNGNIFRVTGPLCGEFAGEFPSQRPVTRSYVFFYLHLNKRLSKQSWGWRFETPSRSLWRHCNDVDMLTLVMLKTGQIRQILWYGCWGPSLLCHRVLSNHHYNDVIMGEIASQITSPTSVYSTVYSDADQRKHQSSASLAFVRGIHRGPVNSPHKWPVTRKMLPFDDVIMMPLGM